MPDWISTPPQDFDIVTGFFPEERPKHNWQENPRPMLVSGVFRGKGSGRVFVRVAYGTSQVEKVRGQQLVIGNMSHLDNLNLAKPTAFVIQPGEQWAILPWSEQHFSPWADFETPVISKLPIEMQEFVKQIMSKLKGLPVPGRC